ncbi:MAG: hypothetical protein IT208_13490 [Chthonomonadales bacterium]|nr:hypothetical protein [Chthonomonadales bacterium]
MALPSAASPDLMTGLHPVFAATLVLFLRVDGAAEEAAPSAPNMHVRA